MLLPPPHREPSWNLGPNDRCRSFAASPPSRLSHPPRSPHSSSSPSSSSSSSANKRREATIED